MNKNKPFIVVIARPGKKLSIELASVSTAKS